MSKIKNSRGGGGATQMCVDKTLEIYVRNALGDLVDTDESVGDVAERCPLKCPWKPHRR